MSSARLLVGTKYHLTPQKFDIEHKSEQDWPTIFFVIPHKWP